LGASCDWVCAIIDGDGDGDGEGEGEDVDGLDELGVGRPGTGIESVSVSVENVDQNRRRSKKE